MRIARSARNLCFLAALVLLLPLAPANAAPGAGSISGVVQDPGGSALSGICVTAYDLAGGTEAGSAVTAPDGTYVIPDLIRSDYTVSFEDCTLPIKHTSEWYDDAPDQTSAEVVTVVPGHDTSGINAVLDRFGSISGVVQDEAGSAIPGICVRVRDPGLGVWVARARTGPDGTYTVKLKELEGSGTFQVWFWDCVRPVKFIPEWYDDVPDGASPTSVAVTAGQATTGVNAVLTRLGSISGTVQSTGSTVPGICVRAYDASGRRAGRARTGPDGTYTVKLDGLRGTADYTVLFEDCVRPIKQVPEWYDDAPDQASATAVSVTAGQDTPNINADLARYSTISGTVQSEGSAIPGICVYAFSVSTGRRTGDATTNADGTYVIRIKRLVGTADFTVLFEDCTRPFKQVSEWYDDAADQASATPVTVVSGQDTPNINADLARYGTISGTVQSTGSGVAGICVRAYDAAGDPAGVRRTGFDGTYRLKLEGLTGTADFTVLFEDCTRPFKQVSEWYNDAPDQVSATPVTATAGQDTPRINADLARYGTISGTVQSTGSGVAGICVLAYDATTADPAGMRRTGPDGTYRLKLEGLTGTEDFTVLFEDCTRPFKQVSEWYNDAADQASATPVTATAGQDTPNVNADLARRDAGAGSFSGTVQSDGSAVAGICVRAEDPTTGRVKGRARTRADGTYTVRLKGLLGTENYKIVFRDCAAPFKHAWEWYDDVREDASITLVAVTAGQDTPNIDADLDRWGRISGTVEGDGGSALSGICVRAYDATTGAFAGRKRTGPDGTYTLTLRGLLGTATYLLEFQDCTRPFKHAPEWYEDAQDQASATPVSVTLDEETSNVDAELARWGAISGTIEGDGGSALSGICVRVFDALDGRQVGHSALTGPDGAYRVKIRVLSGDYTVFFEDCTRPYKHLPEWYEDADDATSATPVVVHAGEDTTVNAVLGDRFAPAIAVTKTASPTSVDASLGGGDVTFAVTLVNLSIHTDPVAVFAMTDETWYDANGDGQREDGEVATLDPANPADPGLVATTCDLLLGTAIPPGGSGACTFTVHVNGSAWEDPHDVITVAVQDNEGMTASDLDDAMVNIIDPRPTAVVVSRLTAARSPDARTISGGFRVSNASAARIDVLLQRLDMTFQEKAGSAWADLPSGICTFWVDDGDGVPDTGDVEVLDAHNAGIVVRDRVHIWYACARTVEWPNQVRVTAHVGIHGRPSTDFTFTGSFRFRP